MAYVVIPTRTSSDSNSSADINQLMDNTAFNNANGGGTFNVTIGGSLITGTKQMAFRVPKATTISNVNAKVDTAPAGSNVQIDVNLDGASIFSTALVIATAATTGTLAPTTTSLTEGQIVSFDIDAIGSATAGGDNLYIEIE